MPKFSERSSKNLAQCHQQLQLLFTTVIKHYDCSVICGRRTFEDQEKAVAEGKSTKRYPYSPHNAVPSYAADVVPWFSNPPHIRWEDKNKFYEFGGFVQGIATMLNIHIRWGGNWDGDDELHDQSFFDLAHFEIVRL